MNNEFEENTCKNWHLFKFDMGKYCENCEKFMKNPEMTHCSDECLLFSMKNSDSLSEFGYSAITWDEKSDPWK